MTISNLNFYYPSIEGGGLEKNLFSLINSLAKKKYRVNLFTYEKLGKNKELKKKILLSQKYKSNYVIHNSRNKAQIFKIFVLYYQFDNFFFISKRNYNFISGKYISNNCSKNT